MSKSTKAMNVRWEYECYGSVVARIVSGTERPSGWWVSLDKAEEFFYGYDGDFLRNETGKPISYKTREEAQRAVEAALGIRDGAS